MADQVNMTAIVMKNMEENGIGASFNRDLAIGYISPDLQDKETQMRAELMPQIEAANKACEESKITETQRDLIVKSATDQLARQAALNERIMNKRR
jgi:hypothetical protein